MLHHDVDAICRCYDEIPALAERLGVKPPSPRLAGFCYPHVSALGAEVIFSPGSEPNVHPMLTKPEQIDDLREPDDYLAGKCVSKRLRTLEKLLKRRPDAAKGIGHLYEGPITTAALLYGQDFFMLPYDDPGRAHRLLSFSVTSAVNYARALKAHFGQEIKPGSVSIPDDFAGMFSPSLFGEFAAPYLERLYSEQEATKRYLHSELLRIDHLPFLTDLRVDTFDPSADQYLTPQLCREHCPVLFTARVQAWDIHDNTAEELQDMYRRYAECGPVRMSFHMKSLDQEEKIRALLDVARVIAGEE